jgi:hypothetical protein
MTGDTMTVEFRPGSREWILKAHERLTPADIRYREKGHAVGYGLWKLSSARGGRVVVSLPDGGTETHKAQSARGAVYGGA